VARKLPDSLAERIRFPDNRNQCWRWIGATKDTGMKVDHGYTYYEGKRITARRAVYIHLRGEPGGPLIPSCGLEQCVNPAHMAITKARRKKAGAYEMVRRRPPTD
jgi:hypothetical protein